MQPFLRNRDDRSVRFLSATEYFPSRTIIQPGWVSSSSSSLSSSLLILFCNGITWERFELSSWNFAWWLVMTLCFESQFVFQFRSRRPAQPAYQPKIQKWANLANFHPIELKLGTEVIYNLPDGNWMFEVAATIFRPTSPTNQNRPKVKISNFCVFCPIWMKFGMGANNGAKTT